MNTPISSLKDLKAEMTTDSELQTAFREDPINAIKKVVKNSRDPLDDFWLYRIIVSVLGLSVLAIIIGVLLLMGNSKEADGLTDSKIPTILTALGSAAIGAIAGLLAPTPRSNG